tara:strand:- start:1244 stop:1729 length:486 start_codon:yes stop_codon:yes gene_type:complete
MANTNKTSFAVSVTPKILMDASDGVNQEMEVINENVRGTVGGSGEITSNSGDTTVAGGWANGVNTAVTSNGSTLAVNNDTDMVFIKHTGFLFGTTTASAAADTVQIKIDASETSDVSADTVILAELRNGEAIILPTPGSTYGLILASGSSHVGVETLIIAT